MDIAEKTRLLNQYYHAIMHKYCTTINKWVVRDDDKCIICDPDKPKCYRVGGDHDTL